MSAGKTTAAILLIIGLVLVGVGSFLPVGENWEETGTIRDTEVFTLFTQKDVRTNDGEVVRDTGARGWNADALDGAEGANQMLAAGIVAIVAMVLTTIGAILAFTPRAYRAGGLLGIFGAVAVAAATALAVVGMRMRTEQTIGDAAALDPRAGIWLLGVGFVLVLVGGVIAASLRRAEDRQVNTWEDYPAHVEAQNEARAQAEADARSLRCPECGTTATAPVGVVPTCDTCGFHRRDQQSAWDAPSGNDGAWAA